MRSYLDIEGWVDAGLTKVYSEAAYRFPSGSTFVEVGSYQGKSTAYMIEQLRLYNKDVNFYAVDYWKNYGVHLAFQRNMMKLGMNQYVKPIRSLSTLAALQFADASLEFVFIDGDHRYAGVKADILAWLPKVKPGGLLAGHDYGCKQCEGIQKALDEILGAKHYDVWQTTWVYEVPHVDV